LTSQSLLFQREFKVTVKFEITSVDCTYK